MLTCLSTQDAKWEKRSTSPGPSWPAPPSAGTGAGVRCFANLTCDQPEGAGCRCQGVQEVYLQETRIRGG